MTRVLLLLSLVASLAVPAGVLALLAADGGSGTASRSAPNDELAKDEIVDLHNELVRIEQLATPGSKGHAREARRIARDAAAWAQQHGPEPESEWYEFANATSDLAQLVAQGIDGAPSFTETAYRRAVARLDVAVAALPPERQPEAP